MSQAVFFEKPAGLWNTLHFMEPEGSLPHSQEHATCPEAEPGHSTTRMQVPEDSF
jgi:hypothetical protein